MGLAHGTVKGFKEDFGPNFGSFLIGMTSISPQMLASKLSFRIEVDIGYATLGQKLPTHPVMLLAYPIKNQV